MAIVAPLAMLLVLYALAMERINRLSHSGDYPDAFAPYMALMPGQPLANAPNCHRRELQGVTYPITYCEMLPDEGPIRWVSATGQEKVQEVQFKVDRLAMADVVRHFGQPERVRSDRGYFYLTWRPGVYAIVEPQDPPQRFSLMMMIKELTLTLEPQPS